MTRLKWQTKVNIDSTVSTSRRSCHSPRGHSLRLAGSPSAAWKAVSLLGRLRARSIAGLFSLTLAYFASVLDNGQDRFGSSHLAYLSVLSMGNLPHIAVGLLSLLCARVDGFPVRRLLLRLRHRRARAP